MVFYTPWIGSILSSVGDLPPGGAETQVLKLAKALARHDLDVAIVAFGSASELPRKLDGVTILARPPYRHRKSLVTKIAETFAIWRALLRAPSRAVVYRGAGIELGLIAIFAKLTRRRLVFSSANIVDFDFRQLMPKRRDMLIYELGARLASAIVVQTEEQVPLCEKAFGRSPTVIKSIAEVAEPHAAPPEAFLWVGRLVAYKRPLEYVALAEALPEARFWMVGVPTPHEEAERLFDAVSAAAARLPNLDLLAPRPHEEIEALMSRAVASVNTADFEGMPNVLLEAWSRGVPALVLNHDPGGVVRTYQLGGFADGSMERFVALAREQWATRTSRDQVSERCRDYVAKHHAPDAVAGQWAEALSDSGRSRGTVPASPAQHSCAG